MILQEQICLFTLCDVCKTRVATTHRFSTDSESHVCSDAACRELTWHVVLAFESVGVV